LAIHSSGRTSPSMSLPAPRGQSRCFLRHRNRHTSCMPSHVMSEPSLAIGGVALRRNPPENLHPENGPSGPTIDHRKPAHVRPQAPSTSSRLSMPCQNVPHPPGSRAVTRHPSPQPPVMPQTSDGLCGLQWSRRADGHHRRRWAHENGGGGTVALRMRWPNQDLHQSCCKTILAPPRPLARFGLCGVRPAPQRGAGDLAFIPVRGGATATAGHPHAGALATTMRLICCPQLPAYRLRSLSWWRGCSTPSLAPRI
jgi:hypothetical protein